jgi:hypothetical protein
MPERGVSALASASLARHLARGAIGFGLIGAAVALTPSRVAVLLLVLPGMVALRGCPTCWVAGLVQTVSAGRLRRACTDTSCKLRGPSPFAEPDLSPRAVPGPSPCATAVSSPSRSQLT